MPENLCTKYCVLV